jgi:glutaredoxin-like protein
LQQQRLLTEKDQEEISSLFGRALDGSSARLKLLTFVPANLESCEYCDTIKELYSEVAALSNGKVATSNLTFEKAQELAEKYRVKRAPATVITVNDSQMGSPALKFYGLPSGYEFSALVEDIIDLANNRPSKLSAATIEKMKKLKSKIHIQVFVTPTCPYCPRAVRIAHMLSMTNPEMIDAEMIEASEFPELSEKYSVMSVPKIVINDSVEFEGALPESIFVSKIDEALTTS